MARIKDLGTRIELFPEDKFCRDISIALYGQRDDQGTRFLVHTYAQYEGAAERVAFVAAELQRLAGLERVAGSDHLRFPCGSGHLVALRRLFYRVCRRDPDLPRPEFSLAIHDGKADCDMVAASLGGGRYRVSATSGSAKAERRVGAVLNGLVRWTEMARHRTAKMKRALPAAWRMITWLLPCCRMPSTCAGQLANSTQCAAAGCSPHPGAPSNQGTMPCRQKPLPPCPK